MKTKPPHTPTLWMIHPDNTECITTIQSAKDNWTPKTLARAIEPQDAAFIVQAVNAHEELLKAAKGVLLNWEAGDLAAATRLLAAAVDKAENGGE